MNVYWLSITSFQSHLFGNSLEFWTRKTIQNSIFFGNAIGFLQIQTPSLNPMHRKFFNNTKSVPKFHYNFLFKWIFNENIVFNNFFTIGWSIMKPTWYTLIHWKLSNNTKNMTRRTIICEILMWQKKKKTTFFHR